MSEAGGATYTPPTDVGDLGPMAVVADPSGAAFGIWQPGTHRGAGLVREEGTFAWMELTTRNQDAALPLYAYAFGWEAARNPGYTEFQLAGTSVAGCMGTPVWVPDGVPSSWMPNFTAADPAAKAGTGCGPRRDRPGAVHRDGRRRLYDRERPARVDVRTAQPQGVGLTTPGRVSDMRVAFLGLGRMGVAMAAHVAQADHELTVWNRTHGKAGPLVDLGAREAVSVADAVAGAEVVVLMLFGPDAVREVLPEVLANAPGTLVVDATTNGPAAAHEFNQLCAAAGTRYIDAPVAGTVKPAIDGTLGVLVGGSEADVAAARPLLELWGDPDRVLRIGEVGSGSALKLCINQGLGVVAAGLGESLRLGLDLGLDRDLLLTVLSPTAYGWYLAQKQPLLQSGDYSATTFSVELMVKDLALAVEAADSDLAVTRASLEQARRALAAGHSGEDYAAITGHLADEGAADSS